MFIIKQKAIYFLLMLLPLCFPAKAAAESKLSNAFTLSLIANPADGGQLEGAGSYPASTPVVVSAAAEQGFIFSHWTNENGELISSQVSFTYTMPDYDSELTAHFICVPGWEPIPNLQHNMQIVAHIMLYDEVSLNPNTVVGAFYGDECRGIASPIPSLDGLVLLTVGSNESTGELIELRIWDSSICDSCDTPENIAFEANAAIGEIDDPLLIGCSNETILSLDFNQGYTWFSVNVSQFYMEPDTLLKDLNPCYDDRIIGQHSFAAYTGSQWVGSLTDISPAQMYRMRLCSAQSIVIHSNLTSNSALQLNAGSTWIGYRPEMCLPVNTALENLTPEPAYNDRIIGQNAFALYNGNTWIGSLAEMCPGKGYISKLTNASELVYPPQMKSINTPYTAIEHHAHPAIGKLPEKNKQYTMMLVTRIKHREKILMNPNDVVFAFIDDELRGTAKPDPAQNGILFLSIGENTYEGKEIRFKVWLNDSQQLLDVKEQVFFKSLDAKGDLSTPFTLTVVQDYITNDQWTIGNPNPNPFNKETQIDVRTPVECRAEVIISNQFGQIVKKFITVVGPANQNITLRKEGLIPGLYFISINLVGEFGIHQVSRKLVIQ